MVTNLNKNGEVVTFLLHRFNYCVLKKTFQPFYLLFFYSITLYVFYLNRFNGISKLYII